VIHGTVASKADVEVAVEGLRGRIRLLQWQVGLVIAALVGIGLPSLWLLVRVAAKAAALSV
jgi:hypothetical protein